jgi:N-acetyl sugar amidotransferase
MVEIKRCGRCVLPDTYPSITFDEHGVCNFCLEAARGKGKPSRKSKSQLDRLVQKYKRRNEKYDVIVGLSGGKDSSYVAYYLKKEYGLKILGLHYNIGYSSLYAIQNLENVVGKLDIDLFSIRPRGNFLRKLFAHFLRERGEFCSVCNNLGYLFGASFSWNQQHTLGFAPLMVGGWSKQYEYQPGISVSSMQYFFDNLTPELLDELKAQPFIEEKIISRYMILEDPRQAGIDTASHNKLGDYAMDFIQLPDYIEWNLKEIYRILSEKLGWRHPPDVHESHFDCTLFPIKEYLKFNKYGLTQETVKNSRLIREGLMTRDEAMERMSLEQTTEPEIFDGFLRELGVSREEINWQAEWSR